MGHFSVVFCNFNVCAFKKNFRVLPKWLLKQKNPLYCSSQLAYIFHASSTVRLRSIISLRSFTISLWISSSSFLASRAFLLFSSCTRHWASKKADFFRVFSILWRSSSFSRLKRFSFTLKENTRTNAVFQVVRDLQNHRIHFEVQNIPILLQNPIVYQKNGGNSFVYWVRANMKF